MKKLTQEHIGMIRAMKDKGQSVTEIAKNLSVMGFVSSYGKPLTGERIRSYLANNKHLKTPKEETPLVEAPKPQGDVTPLMVANFVWKSLSDEKKCFLIADLIKKNF